MTRRAEVAERLARADPAGLLYGGIVTATVLATVSAHAGQKQHVAVATFVVLVVYWLPTCTSRRRPCSTRGTAGGSTVGS